MGDTWRRFFDCGVLVVGSYPDGWRGEYPLVEACRKIFRDGFSRSPGGPTPARKTDRPRADAWWSSTPGCASTPSHANPIVP